MLASVILDQVSRELNDTARVRWPVATLLANLSAAQRAVALVRPDASSTIDTVVLTAGTQQALPANGLRLLDVVRNIGLTGEELPGEPIRRVERRALDEFTRDWHSRTGTLVINEFAYDEKLPKTYWVSPPALTGARIEIVYSANPAALTAVGDAIGIDDVYEAPLRFWTLYLCYVQNTEQRSFERGWRYATAFFSALGAKVQSDMLVSPNMEAEKK